MRILSLYMLSAVVCQEAIRQAEGLLVSLDLLVYAVLFSDSSHRLPSDAGKWKIIRRSLWWDAEDGW